MTYSFALSSSSGFGPAVRAAESDSPWEALALAIVAQAILDYMPLYTYALLRQRRSIHTAHQGDLQELEAFFRGPWYKKLCDMDGAYLLRQVREHVEQEVLA